MKSSSKGAALVAALVSAVAYIVIVGLIMSFPVYLLWNGCLIGAVDGVHEITWLQAWGLMILFSFLFKTNVTKKD